MSEARPASLGHKLQDIQKVLFFPRQLFSRPFTVTENNSHKLHWILNLRVLKYEVFVLNSLGSYFQWESWTLHIYVYIIVSSSFLTKIFSLFKWLFFSNRARYRKVEKKKKRRKMCWEMAAGRMTEFMHRIGGVYVSLLVSLSKIGHIRNLALLYHGLSGQWSAIWEPINVKWVNAWGLFYWLCVSWSPSSSYLAMNLEWFNYIFFQFPHL